MGMRAMRAVLAAVVFCFSVLAQRDSTAQAALEKAAAGLSVFATSDFVYNRWPHVFSAELEQSYQRPLAPLIEANYPAGELVPLLAHRQPAVRTLAMALLFHKDAPQLLAHLVPLVSDQAPTLPDLPLLAYTQPMAIADFPKSPQTVGQVADRMLKFYLEPAGYHYGVQGTRGHPGWAEYWAAHKDRAYCLSWLRVRLNRATAGISPPQKDRRNSVLRLRAYLDQLPPVDRDLYLMWLTPLSPDRSFATDGELLEAAGRLGRERILAIAGGHPPSDDPDLAPAIDAYLYKQVVSFLLDRADKFLLPADAPVIAAIEQHEIDHLANGESSSILSPSYDVARARLDPENASAILHSALARYNGRYDWAERGRLAAKLWELRGQAEETFLLDWFYRESELIGNTGPVAQRTFIDALTSRDARFLASLVTGPGAPKIPGEVLAMIHERIPNPPPKPFLDWLYAQKAPSGGRIDLNGGYFLQYLERCHDHAMLRAAIENARLPSLPVPLLLRLQQILVGYKLPAEAGEALTRPVNALYAFEKNGTTPDPAVVRDLVTALRSNAKYIRPDNAW